MMIRTVRLFVPLCVGLLLLAGCSPAPADADDTEQAVPVGVQTVERGAIEETVTLTGSLHGRTEVDVVANSPGRVSEVKVATGDRVEAGQELVRLSTAELQAQLKQAEAALSMARSAQEQAAASLEQAQSEYNRMKTLYEQGAISEQQWEQVRFQLDQARMRAGEGSSAQVNQAAASIEMIRTQLENAVIKAPISGIISERSIEPGELASPGIPLMRVVDMSAMKVTGSVPELQVSRIQTGQTVRVHIGSLGAEPFEGKITRISPTADAATKSFPIEVEIPNPEGRLRSGMFAEIELPLSSRDDALIVPEAAILERNGQMLLFVVEDGIARERVVEIGLRAGGRVEVLSGVDVGDSIVTVGQRFLQDGMAVQIAGNNSNGEPSSNSNGSNGEGAGQ